MPTPPPPDHSRWKPGQSGNPAGSSNKQRLTNALLRMLDEKELDAAFIKAGMAEALKGDFNFWRYIFERIDGKIPDNVKDDEDLDDQPPRDEHGDPIEP